MRAGRKNGRKRPGLLDACRLYLAASIGAAFAYLAELLLPADVLWLRYVVRGLYAVLALAVPAMRCVLRLRRKGRAARLRLRAPNIAQCVLTLLAACMYVLLADDLTLLWGSALERWSVVPRLAVQVGSSLTERLCGILLIGALVPLCESLFFFCVEQAAWERRGSRWAAWASAALFASLGGDLTAFPARLVLGLSAATIIVHTGSWPLGTAFLVLTGTARQTAATLRAAALDITRLEDLASSLGGTEGALKLALETALLGAGFYCIVRAVCAVRGRGGTFRERPAEVRPLGSAEVFLLTSGGITAAAILLTDALVLYGLLP